MAKSLNATLGAMLDALFRSAPLLAGFARMKPSAGHELRCYFMETSFAQREICFYRDKWWTKEGGTLYWELSCLVPMVQRVLTGTYQSLATPDYKKPFAHFQYGLLEKQPHREWKINSEADVDALYDDLEQWLPTSAVKWLEQFEVTVRRSRLTPGEAGVAGWRGETTIFSIPPNPATPDRE